MPAPTAAISTGTPNAERMTRTMNQNSNPDFVFMGNANVARPPSFYVRIFNVSDYEQKIERPWVSFNPAHKSKVIIIKAKKPGEMYSAPFLISDVVQIPDRNIHTGQMGSYGVDGKFLAQDALNPDEPQGNWKTVRELGAGQAGNEGTNLYHWGLFWTLNETPTDEEVLTAVARMEANYNRLIDEAKTLWMSGEQGRKQIGNTHRRAAQYYRQEFEWNQVYKATQECPGCGSRISMVAVVCPKCPATLNWEKALSLGLRTVDQAVAAGIMEPQAEHLAKKK